MSKLKKAVTVQTVRHANSMLISRDLTGRFVDARTTESNKYAVTAEKKNIAASGRAAMRQAKAYSY